MKKIDQESITAEQEQEWIVALKKQLKSLVIENKFCKVEKKTKHIAVYALLELAAEIAGTDFIGPEQGLFVEAAVEVHNMMLTDPDRILKY